MLAPVLLFSNANILQLWTGGNVDSAPKAQREVAIPNLVHHDVIRKVRTHENPIHPHPEKANLRLKGRGCRLSIELDAASRWAGTPMCADVI
jgi:hypothetical protein